MLVLESVVIVGAFVGSSTSFVNDISVVLSCSVVGVVCVVGVVVACVSSSVGLVTSLGSSFFLLTITVKEAEKD